MDRFFAAGGGDARALVEGRIEETVHFALGKVRVIVYCPAKEMQLKEARIPCAGRASTGSVHSPTSPTRCPASETSSGATATWKFYVLCDSGDPDVSRRSRSRPRSSRALNVYSLGS